MAEEEAAREAQVKSLQQLKDREREGLFESLAQGEFINTQGEPSKQQKPPFALVPKVAAAGGPLL